MKCSSCKKEIEVSMKFCPYCGQVIKRQCARCGASYQPGYLFCSECGMNLSIEEPVKSNTLEIALHSVDKDEKDIRKHATVLFADVKGSTDIVEKLDPEEAKDILLPIVDAMREAIFSYGGTLIKTAGDGIVAIFGAPQALEDHALRACLAALSIQDKIMKLNTDIKVRVGLNSGEVYLEMIGDENHREYDIAGQTVHLAARMEQTAKPGTVQITQNTFSLVEKDVQAISIGAVEIKGFSQPIDVFELQAVSKKNKLQSDIKERPTFLPFIGRKKEIDQLNQLAERAQSGHGNAVGIIAEAGQGKSRLLYEFLHKQIVTKNFDVLMTRGFSHTQNIPYFSIIQALQHWMEINTNETEQSLHKKIQSFLVNVTVPHALDAILVLFGTPPMDLTWNKLERALKRKYQLNTLIAIFITAAAKKPLALIIEDIHWIDSETKAFLDVLISHLNRARVLLIVTSRLEYDDGWIKKSGYTQIKLEALSQSDESAALDELLGDHPSLLEIKTQLLQNCAGNPFFLEEMIKSLIRDKILIGTINHFHLNDKMLTNKIQLPESIFAILQAQLDSLSTLERKTLRIASVIGERFTYLMLSKIMDEEKGEIIQQVLRELTDNQYIYDTRIYPEPESAFKHALIHEVTYNSLLKSLRRSMHIKILSILETLPTKDQDLLLKAHHAYQGESWDKAFHYYFKGANYIFFSLSANKSAAELYEKALISAEHLPKQEEIMRDCLYIHMYLIVIYRRLTRMQDEGHHIKEMEKLLLLPENKNQQELRTLFYSAKGVYYLTLGETLQAKHWYNESYNACLQCEDKMIKAVSESSCAFIYLFTGEYATLYKRADHALQILPTLGYRHDLFPLPIGHFSNWMKSWAHAYTGDYHPKEKFEEQIKYLSNSVDIHQLSIDAVYVLMAIGLLYFYQRLYDKAIEHLLRALSFTTDLEILQYIPSIVAALGISYLHLNKKEEGKKFIDQAVQAFNDVESYISKMLALDLITEGLLLIGDYSFAKTFCQQAIQIAERCELAGIKTTLLRLSAEIDLHDPLPDYVSIEQKLQESIERGKKLGMVSNAGHCQWVLAKMHRQAGNIEASKQAEQAAHQCYEELNMPISS